ncbi:FAD-dependent oxidoreductase [Streptomyces sp. NPDC004539]|uniref:FAD-dependent oxidoreductase n=1 Tax=Streptomyces sp. NPDC004539 TaxID=3154280 RepID=UPI0033B993FB
MSSVLVIGAGVIGLTTAVHLAESGHEVRVETESLPEETTSAAAGASWDPYLAEPLHLVESWSRRTLTALRALSEDPASGVRLVEGTHESRIPCALPAWASWADAKSCAPRPGYAEAWRYRAPVIDMPRYLTHLTERLRAAGGTLRRRRYETLPPAPVVVNCTGIGARSLVDDPSVHPVRGRLVVVRNPGIDTFFCDDTPDADELTYFYPHFAHVVLGGTADAGAWDTGPDPETARRIVRRCAEVEPALAGAELIGHRVGLRPVRPQVRLEREGNVIHNYGHGGAGVTLSWGCAQDVEALLTD